MGEASSSNSINPFSFINLSLSFILIDSREVAWARLSLKGRAEGKAGWNGFVNGAACFVEGVGYGLRPSTAHQFHFTSSSLLSFHAACSSINQQQEDSSPYSFIKERSKVNWKIDGSEIEWLVKSLGPQPITHYSGIWKSWFSMEEANSSISFIQSTPSIKFKK